MIETLFIVLMLYLVIRFRRGIGMAIGLLFGWFLFNIWIGLLALIIVWGIFEAQSEKKQNETIP